MAGAADEPAQTPAPRAHPAPFADVIPTTPFDEHASVQAQSRRCRAKSRDHGERGQDLGHVVPRLGEGGPPCRSTAPSPRCSPRATGSDHLRRASSATPDSCCPRGCSAVDQKLSASPNRPEPSRRPTQSLRWHPLSAAWHLRVEQICRSKRRQSCLFRRVDPNGDGGFPFVGSLTRANTKSLKRGASSACAG